MREKSGVKNAFAKYWLPLMSLVMTVSLVFCVQCKSQPRKSKDSDAAGQVRITYGQAQLHKTISIINDFPTLVEPFNIRVEKGEVVELLAVIPTGMEHPFYFKLKTAQGAIGYANTSIEPVQAYNDRGAALFVYLQTPYEYECFIPAVDNMISKYTLFINQYPNSKYVPYALKNIAYLHRYTLQCRQDDVKKNERIAKLNKIYAVLLVEIFKPGNAAVITNIIKNLKLKEPSYAGPLGRHEAYDFYTFQNYAVMVVDSLAERLFPNPIVLKG